MAYGMKLLSEYGVRGTRLMLGLYGALATDSTFGKDVIATLYYKMWKLHVARL